MKYLGIIVTIIFLISVQTFAGEAFSEVSDIDPIQNEINKVDSSNEKELEADPAAVETTAALDQKPSYDDSLENWNGEDFQQFKATIINKPTVRGKKHLDVRKRALAEPKAMPVVRVRGVSSEDNK